MYFGYLIASPPLEAGAPPNIILAGLAGVENPSLTTAEDAWEAAQHHVAAWKASAPDVRDMVFNVMLLVLHTDTLTPQLAMFLSADAFRQSQADEQAWIEQEGLAPDARD